MKGLALDEMSTYILIKTMYMHTNLMSGFQSFNQSNFINKHVSYLLQFMLLQLHFCHYKVLYY